MIEVALEKKSLLQMGALTGASAHVVFQFLLSTADCRFST
jgi:hypothetical protein